MCFLLVTFLCTSKEKLPARPAAERKLCSGEQREVTRSPDASGKPQDARQEKNEIKITAVPPSPAPSARPLPPAGEAGWLQAEREVRPRTEWRAGALLGRGARLHAAIDEIRLGLTVDHGLVDDDLADVLERGQFVHRVEQHLFEDRAQT